VSSEPRFACSSDNDECLDDSQCSDGKTCAYNGDHFACMSAGCQTGRPFYIEGQLRTAPIVDRRDWPSSLDLTLDGVPAEARAALARRWGHIGQLEHASVASFARFALQLLSLGAPPELVEQTTSAMADETVHARLAFGLASAYGGSPVGPGKLEVDDALGANDVQSILRTLVHEGCVGETFAAALARREQEQTAEPVVRAVLGRIAEDEERHALLAWRSLEWLVRRCGQSREAAAALWGEIGVLEREVAARPPSPPRASPDADLARYGVVAEAEMADLRALVLRTIVLPAARALLGRAPSSRLAGALTASP
jgi:hypothetical protein